MKDSEESLWDVTIGPNQNLFELGLDDVWRFRDLIGLFVHRNFIVNYRQTILGPFWYVVQPLMTTAVFTIVFGLIGRMPTDGVPPILFYLSGVVVWSNYASNVISTADVFVANMGVFGKVYFPRLTIPIATVLTNLITLAVHLAVFVFAFILADLFGAAARPTWWVLMFPLLFAANIMMAFGVGLIVSAATTRYRDLSSMIGTIMQLWMYASPVFYPLSQVPEKWRLLAALNPVSTIIELFRIMVFGVGAVSVSAVLISAVVVVIVFLSGLVMFHQAELNAADTV
jgi:lipopolysaccharide transport system permease protein